MERDTISFGIEEEEDVGNLGEEEIKVEVKEEEEGEGENGSEDGEDQFLMYREMGGGEDGGGDNKKGCEEVPYMAKVYGVKEEEKEEEEKLEDNHMSDEDWSESGDCEPSPRKRRKKAPPRRKRRNPGWFLKKGSKRKKKEKTPPPRVPTPPPVYTTKEEFIGWMESRVRKFVVEAIAEGKEPRALHRFYLGIHNLIMEGMEKGFVKEGDEVDAVWIKCDGMVDEVMGKKNEIPKATPKPRRVGRYYVKRAKLDKESSKTLALAVRRLKSTVRDLVLESVDANNGENRIKHDLKTRREFLEKILVLPGAQMEEDIPMGIRHLWEWLVEGKGEKWKKYVEKKKEKVEQKRIAKLPENVKMKRYLYLQCYKARMGKEELEKREQRLAEYRKKRYRDMPMDKREALRQTMRRWRQSLTGEKKQKYLEGIYMSMARKRARMRGEDPEKVVVSKPGVRSRKKKGVFEDKSPLKESQPIPRTFQEVPATVPPKFPEVYPVPAPPHPPVVAAFQTPPIIQPASYVPVQDNFSYQPISSTNSEVGSYHNMDDGGNGAHDDLDFFEAQDHLVEPEPPVLIPPLESTPTKPPDLIPTVELTPPKPLFLIPPMKSTPPKPALIPPWELTPPKPLVLIPPMESTPPKPPALIPPTELTPPKPLALIHPMESTPPKPPVSLEPPPNALLPVVVSVTPRTTSNRAPRGSSVASAICDACGKKFYSNYDLRQHQKVKHNPNHTKRKCPQCHLEFQLPRTLWRHIIKAHAENTTTPPETTEAEGDKRYNCETCLKDFAAPENLRRHQFYMHGEGANEDFKLTCEHCGKGFKRRSSLTEHIRRAHKGIHFRCDICSRDCLSPGLLWKHKVDLHGMSNLPPPPNAETCQYCGEIILSSGALTQHIGAVHPEHFDDHIARQSQHMTPRQPRKTEKQVDKKEEGKQISLVTKVKCEVCSKEMFLHSVRRHMRNVHRMGNAKSFPCPECGKEFKEKHYLTEHQKLVHIFKFDKIVDSKGLIKVKYEKMEGDVDKQGAKKIMTCSVCDEVLVNRVEFRTHLFTKHPDLFQQVTTSHISLECEICTKKFSSDKDLRFHLTTEHSDLSWNCPECSKFISSQLALKKHVRNHSKPKEKTDVEKQRKCQHCEERLASDAAIWDHVWDYHPDKVVHCPYCGKPKWSKKLLYDHYKCCQAKKEAVEEKGKDDNKVICDLCGNKLKNQASLDRHMRGVHGVYKQEYACGEEGCGSSFKKKEELGRHLEEAHGKYQEDEEDGKGNRKRRRKRATKGKRKMPVESEAVPKRRSGRIKNQGEDQVNLFTVRVKVERLSEDEISD